MADRLVCLDDFQTFASRNLAKFIFEFYVSGSDNETSLTDNVQAFKRYRLLPRVLRDVSTVDMTTTILGHKVAFPVGIAPTSMQKMAHHEGECATARAAAAMETVFTLSTYSTSSMSDVTQGSKNSVKFFQMYIPEESDPRRPVTRAILREAENHGFSAIVLTVDHDYLAVRRRNLRNNFRLPSHLKVEILKDLLPGVDLNDIRSFHKDKSLTWNSIGWLRSVTSLPIVLKGIMSPADAALAAECGVAAVWVSNHGGRQLDTVPATIDVLESVVRAVAGRCEVYMDGGVRCGTDVLKALALGARAVFIGRPIVYGLAYDGMSGVLRVLELLKHELFTAMALSGCSKITDIHRELVMHQTDLLSKL